MLPVSRCAEWASSPLRAVVNGKSESPQIKLFGMDLMTQPWLRRSRGLLPSCQHPLRRVFLIVQEILNSCTGIDLVGLVGVHMVVPGIAH